MFGARFVRFLTRIGVLIQVLCVDYGTGMDTPCASHLCIVCLPVVGPYYHNY